jgi:hypothetical protein
VSADASALTSRPVVAGCSRLEHERQRSPAEPKSVVEHLRVIEKKSTVVGGENQAEISRAAPFCASVQGVFDAVNLEHDDALAAGGSAAQQALIWPEGPGLSVVVLPDQLRVSTARPIRRTWVA